ncbi:hypothetical protein COO60DRAFT_1536262 [Scenedesmus sp. NREL 46B-D3]|nr:hypothetical protein COO60DRAFT_1536262 [Scenedesmus sp. NREL 46B-D3]
MSSYDPTLFQHAFAAGLPRLPAWLQATADRRSLRQPEKERTQTIRQETCYVDEIDGVSIMRCQELVERFRLCADGQKEMVESSTSSHVLPYGTGMRCSSSSRHDDLASAALNPAFAATLGQMLDDFFQYATELQQSLEQQDAPADAGYSWRLPSAWSSSNDSSSSEQPGLFGWWQRRKGNSAAAGSSNGGQPSLQQLVRASSSLVQEI